MRIFPRNYNLVHSNPCDGQPLSYLGIVVKSTWLDTLSSIISRKNVKAWFLNIELGWRCKRYSFLRDIPKILELDIVDSHSQGIEGVEYQDELVDLGLNLPNAYSIDFRKLRKLRILFLYGRKQNRTLYECSSLEELYIDEMKLGDDHELSRLVNLRKLTIGNSNLTDFSFLQSLSKLEKLTLLNCENLKSLSMVGALPGLKHLHVAGMKDVGDLDFVHHLKNLEILVVEDAIVVSIVPVSGLDSLKAALAIFGRNSRISDGNLEPISHLQNLSMLNIPNRRHYNYHVNNLWDWNNLDKPRHGWLSKKD